MSCHALMLMLRLTDSLWQVSSGKTKTPGINVFFLGVFDVFLESAAALVAAKRLT